MAITNIYFPVYKEEDQDKHFIRVAGERTLGSMFINKPSRTK